MGKWDIFGITEKEYEIYASLLKEGSSTISHIAKKAEVDQRNAYDYIERLINKGLVGQIIHNGKRTFLALNPEMLDYFIDDEKQKLSSLLDKADLGSDILHMTLISSKKDLYKAMRRISAEKIFVSKSSKEIISDPQIKIFIAKNKPKIIINENQKKKTKSGTKKINPINEIDASKNEADAPKVYAPNIEAQTLSLIGKKIFLVYSIPEQKGFYTEETDFIKNMGVYFS